MTKEELLRPRFKVIADYPDSCLDVGEIITIGEGIFEAVEWWRKYPNVFKELIWYEERSIEEMPKYVKSNYGGNFQGYGIVIKTEEEADSKIWPICLMFAFIQGYANRISFSNLLPATEQEYLTFKNEGK